MTFSRWFPIGITLFALSGTAALAGDASADRPAAQRATRGEKREVGPSAPARPAPQDEGSIGGPCGECCARSKVDHHG